MKLTNIQHIFFDLDHTLWDFDKNSGLAFDATFQKNNIPVEVDRFLEIYKPINQNYWKLYRDNKISQTDLRYGRLKESFELLEIILTEEQISLLSTDYIAFLPQNNHLLAGSKEALEYLTKNYNLHIITNGFKQVQHQKLENSGIAHYFESMTTSEEAGVKKPNKRIFEKALEIAGAQAAKSVMIGDNLEADIAGAQAIGMHAILFNYYKEDFSPDYLQLLEMSEIAAFL